MNSSEKSWEGWDMSSEWKSFASLLSAIVDNRGKTCPVGENGIPLIATNCIDNSSLYPLYDTTRFVSDETFNTWFRDHPLPGDILFVCKGSPGRTNLVPDPVDFCIAQDMVAVRADPEKVYPKYLFAVLRSPIVQSKIENMHVGTMIPHFKKGDFDKLFIPVPSREVQRAIGDFYFTISDRIALLRETNATLESIAQAIFKSWFIDFDPVKARQQGLEPQGMDAATAALFPDAFQDSELGPIPARWDIAKLEDVYDINPSRKLKKGEIAPYLGMSSVPTSGHSVGEVIDREMASGTKFINGDTLLARITPCLENGKTAYVDFLDDEQVGWGSTEFIVLRPKAPFASYHAYLLCRDSSFRTFAIQSMSGTSGRQRVQNDVLGSYRLVLPSEEILTAFSDVIEPIKMAMTSNHKRSQTLASIRDALLPRLISGRLRLPEAEAMAVEAGL